MAEFHDGSKASEGAGLTSTHVSWAERGQMARPDTRGTGRILLPARDQQGEVATLEQALPSAACLLSLSGLHALGR